MWDAGMCDVTYFFCCRLNSRKRNSDSFMRDVEKAE